MATLLTRLLSICAIFDGYLPKQSHPLALFMSIAMAFASQLMAIGQKSITLSIK